MVTPLQDILEVNFYLMYRLNMQITEIDKLDVKEIMWYYNRLIKEKQKERPEWGK